jgi:hypothetical protein
MQSLPRQSNVQLGGQSGVPLRATVVASLHRQNDFSLQNFLSDRTDAYHKTTTGERSRHQRQKEIG